MKEDINLIIKYIDLQQLKYLEMLKKNKKVKKEVDAILTATTLIKLKCKSLIKN